MTGHKRRRVEGPPNGTYPTVDSITKKGTIIYRIGQSAIRDDGAKLAVSRGATQACLDAVLRMAIERYGRHLIVNGSEEFKARVAIVAAKNRLTVTFADDNLDPTRRSIAQAAVISPGRAFGRRLDERKQNGVVDFDITKHGKRNHARRRSR